MPMSINIDMPNPETHVPRLRRLYHWLTYNRLTIFLYAGSFFLLPKIILSFLAVLAILFAPYVVFVLYKNGKRGWLLFFAIITGIPTGFAFLHTGNSLLDTALPFFPLATFYLYCVILRYSVADWISDASPIGEQQVEYEDKQNVLD